MIPTLSQRGLAAWNRIPGQQNAQQPTTILDEVMEATE